MALALLLRRLSLTSPLLQAPSLYPAISIAAANSASPSSTACPCCARAASSTAVSTSVSSTSEAEAIQPSAPQTRKERWRELRYERLNEATGGRNHLRRQFKRMQQAVATQRQRKHNERQARAVQQAERLKRWRQRAWFLQDLQRRAAKQLQSSSKPHANAA